MRLLYLVHGRHQIDLAALDRILGALGHFVVVGLHHGAQVPLGLTIPFLQVISTTFRVLRIDGASINPFQIRTYFLGLSEFLGHIGVLKLFNIALILTVFFTLSYHP